METKVHVSMVMKLVFDWHCHPQRPIQVANDDDNNKYNRIQLLSSILFTEEKVIVPFNLMKLHFLKTNMCCAGAFSRIVCRGCLFQMSAKDFKMYR